MSFGSCGGLFDSRLPPSSVTLHTVGVRAAVRLLKDVLKVLPVIIVKQNKPRTLTREARRDTI